MQKKYVLGGHIDATIASIQKITKIFLFSIMQSAQVVLTGKSPYNDPQQALDDAICQSGEVSEVLTLPKPARLFQRL